MHFDNVKLLQDSPYQSMLKYNYRRGGAVLSDEQICHLIKINPMAYNSAPGEISYGLTSYGYDLRIDSHYKVFTGLYNIPVDPKNFNERCLQTMDCEVLNIPPNSFALGVSVEELEIPRDVLGICVGKSTYARCGIIVNITPLEPEWKGKVTIEISNTTPSYAKIYSHEGIAQVIFLRSCMDCQVSYADKKGVYQNQTGLTLPRIKS